MTITINRVNGIKVSEKFKTCKEAQRFMDQKTEEQAKKAGK